MLIRSITENDMDKKNSIGSFIVLSNHILHFHKKLAVLKISWVTTGEIGPQSRLYRPPECSNEPAFVFVCHTPRFCAILSSSRTLSCHICRPAKSHGISVSLQKVCMISRSHGNVKKPHGISLIFYFLQKKNMLLV